MWQGVDPQEDWKEGPAKIARWRYVGSLIFVKMGAAATAWKLLGWEVAVPILTCLGCLAGVLYYLRRMWIRELKIGVAFHAACHYIRDAAANLERLVLAGKAIEYASEYQSLHERLANRIADYFRAATRDDTVNCAIRLVRRGDDGTDAYVTKGRSNGMMMTRKDVTVPIPSDKGLARKLRDEGALGVCQVVDIKDGINNNWWMECPSDRYSDVKFLMVAPINWYGEDCKKVMGGILYVTSRRNNLAAHHVEPVKAFADLLGMVYPAVTGTFLLEGTD